MVKLIRLTIFSFVGLCNVINIYYSDHYWPMDTVPVYYGDIKVTLLNESHYPDWLITEFMMQRVSFELFYGINYEGLSFWMAGSGLMQFCE